MAGPTGNPRDVTSHKRETAYAHKSSPLLHALPLTTCREVLFAINEPPRARSTPRAQEAALVTC